MADFSELAGDLSGVQKAFLSLLSGAEKVGVGGTPLKIYNDVVQRGRTSPITEADLSQAEREALLRLVRGKAEATGSRSGSIDYPDYAKYGNGLSENLLGGFRYSLGDDGAANVSDVYDFNANRAGPPIENNQAMQAFAVLANPRGLAAQIGRKIVPDTSGRGVPVQIKLSQ
jgi:hypothetical protein